MKKFLLLFSVMLCAISSWAEDVTIGIFTFNLDENTGLATVTGFADGVTDADVVIPSTVTYNNVNYDVSTIADNAFEGCTFLVSIGLEGLTGIGDGTFTGCSSLKSLTIPRAISSWGSDFLDDCTSLESLYILDPATFFGTIDESNVTVGDFVNLIDNVRSSNLTIYLNASAHETNTQLLKHSDFSYASICVERTLIPLSIGTTGYATFSHSSAVLDFTDTDVNAYIVSAYLPSNGEVILTRINYVPASTGIVVKGKAGLHAIFTTDETIVLSNMLKPNLIATANLAAETGYTNYVLGTGEYGIGFYESDGTLGANKAYLPLPTDKLPSLAPVRGLHITFNDGEYDDVTGIVEVEDDRSLQGEGVYYNLQGQRVERPTKGIYIVNGKKIFLR